MVGSVIVFEGEIIGEGYHEFFGGAHAEVNAINSVDDKSLLSRSTLYVNLEPCSHFGKTPPCAELLISKNIPEVIIGCSDPNPLVSGKGIIMLKEEGIKVSSGILEKESIDLNRRFITFQKQSRPYIILKWAQSRDRYIDILRDESSRGSQRKISSAETNILVHQWRSEEQAILIGRNTAIKDNPELTVRHTKGRNPVRILIDPSGKVPADSKIFNSATRTVVFGETKSTCEKIAFRNLSTILDWCGKEKIISLLVEGGRQTLSHFIDEGFWDEIRVIENDSEIGSGISAPNLPAEAIKKSEIQLGSDTITFYRKKK